jgi:hypothetical protein
VAVSVDRVVKSRVFTALCLAHICLAESFIEILTVGDGLPSLSFPRKSNATQYAVTGSLDKCLQSSTSTQHSVTHAPQDGKAGERRTKVCINK